jgi:hypothetical protein
MTSFAAAVGQIMGDVRQAVPPALVNRVTAALGVTGRDRILR